MRLSDHDKELLITIIFEWDRWITMNGMETDIGGEDMEQIKKLFGKIYSEYWYKKESM